MSSPPTTPPTTPSKGQTGAVIEDSIPWFPMHTFVDKTCYPTWVRGVGDLQNCPTYQRGMVYVLVCEDEFIYVGFVTASGNIASRISMHISGAGSKLTVNHAVKYVRQCIYPATKETERRVTKWMAENCPDHKVRGGPYCDPAKSTPWGR